MNKPNSTSDVLAPVEKTLRVELPVEAAFRLFTEGIGGWWPLRSHSVGGEKTVTCVMEGWVGGRIYEVQEDQSQREWGRVLSWEPLGRVVFSWHPGRTPDTAQEVEVTFQPQDGGTRLTLIHKDWERVGTRAKEMREDYVTGWDYVLGKYAGKAVSSI